MKHQFWVGTVLAAMTACTSWGAEQTSPAKAPAVEKPASTSTNSAQAIIDAKDYTLPEVGTLHLSVPKTWRDSFKKTIEVGTRVEELKFQPREGNDFAILVAAIHMVDAGKVRDFDTRSAALEGVKAELAGAVETALVPHDFKGAEVTGSYVDLTDKNISATNPKPGEYKYLTQGYAKLSPIILTFRLLSNRPDGPEKAALVQMIESARLTTDK
ncbi:MAG: hypothetical protein JWR69_1921 [Pedosphaera sp.]|nr:hypothetical protein [Pedosphaera sp.]